MEARAERNGVEIGGPTRDSDRNTGRGEQAGVVGWLAKVVPVCRKRIEEGSRKQEEKERSGENEQMAGE